MLQAILNETLDLAKVRAVDLDSIQDAGQVLPALYFPFNPVSRTIMTNVAEIRMEAIGSVDHLLE